MNIQVPISLSAHATLPEYQTPGAAGMDLCSTIEFTLEPQQRLLVPTGIRVAIPQGFEGQVRPRSGLAIRHGISMVNTPGTIDSDYRGEISVIMINLGQDVVQVKIGERIAQLVICPIARAEWVVVEDLGNTGRGDGGFGSTGV